jgi:Alginate lyase/Immunoglobulin I-set domain
MLRMLRRAVCRSLRSPQSAVMKNTFLQIGICVAFWSFTLTYARALDPSQPPGSNFDLSHWYLQLPTSGGVLTGTSGSVDSFSTAQLGAGSTNAYFYTGPDGAMTFWVPDDGAITGGSTHPRSELRELLDPNNSGINWNLYGYHSLTVQCKVLQVPSDTQKVCIGQIHEPNYLVDGVTPSANNEEMIMFDLGNQRIYANINLDGDTNNSFSQTFVSGTSVKTNSTINYAMVVSNGVLTIILNNVTNAWNLFSGTNYQGHIAQNWDLASGNTVYFKAGDYNQTANTCGCSTDGAKVAFYTLTAYHAAAISNQPAAKTGVPGGSVTFTVGAVGNSALSYQWFFNTTNLLAGATNATLALTNLTGANLGNYSVVVSDSTPDFNSVTSAVVALTGHFPPVITSQPASQSVFTGSNAVFNVGANGSTPLTNHWWFNSTNNLSWATGNTLTITNAQATNVGDYFLIINNAYGSATSSVASLTLDLPPLITNQPVSQRVNLGANAVFAVGVSGTPPLSYGWWMNGTNIPGANSNSLSLSNINPGNAGNYFVLVTNVFGSTTSAIATLTVVGTATFTNAGSTNWLCPAGVTSVQVECWGGGGAGGGAVRTSTGNAFAGGGAGGAYTRANSIIVNPGALYGINVGAGGVSSTNDLGAVSGGDSWFGLGNTTNCLATGGAGGTNIFNLGSSGRKGGGGPALADGCVGDVIYPGGSGGSGATSPYNYGGGGGGGAGDSHHGYDASSTTNSAGSGGDGLMVAGGAGGNGMTGTSGNGSDGLNPGGGGGGARGSNTNSPYFGGAGGSGLVVVTYSVGEGCTPATAAIPTGDGSGTNGLTTCASQPITLTETPSAGTGPFTFAWKKVGSDTVLGTSSNLVVSEPVDGDQYTCDVTAACGAASTSPAATLSVSGPGVTLLQTTQTVYRTMPVYLSATLSGSATGGNWSSSGSGSFTSSNSPGTIYMPSAADAGTTVTLTFTTTNSGACGTASASDFVTFSLAANPAKTVLIKADDFRGTNSAAYQTAWTTFLQTSRALGVKVGIGVICTNNIDPYFATSQPLVYQATTNWMQTEQAVGDVEFWNHAWIHSYYTNGNGTVVYEYSNDGLAMQQFYLTNSQAALFNALGHDVIAFGPAYNQIDTNTATVINQTPAVKLLFASSPNTIRSYGLTSSVAVVKIISESGGTGNPIASAFEAAYPGGPAGPVALQFHPPYFASTNFLEYSNIVLYLLTNGYSILLPSEYVASLPAITNQPASRFAPAGGNVVFSVGATGDPTLAYQWQLNGTNFFGANTATLTVTNVGPTVTGGYSVIVTNFSGAVTSAVATLTIQAPPSVTHALVSNGIFQLSFSGTPGASYLVLVKTNLSDPAWTIFSTNIVDVIGNGVFLIPTSTHKSSQFFRLAAP